MSDYLAACAFCRIAQGSEHHHAVFEDANHIAFLDKRPVFFGHTLLIPKRHTETFYDLPPDSIHPFFHLAQKMGKAVERGMGAEGTFMAINNTVSQSVPHLHIHLIPRKKGDGLRGFFWPRQQYQDEAHFAAVRDQIKKQLG